MSLRKPSKREGAKIVSSRIKMNRADDKDEKSPVIAEREMKLLFAPSRYLVFSKFNNVDRIHIREYDIKSNETERIEYPTMKGICLTTGRLKVLLNKITEIDERLKRRYPPTPYKTHLGAGIYVSVTEFNCVDFRRHWIPEGQIEVIPTKRGITISPTQWKSLKEKLEEMLSTHPELATGEVCFHQNQMDIFNCSECMPFGLFT